MKLSIVIPTYNSYDKTYKLISSLEKQDLTDIEVIVVNDASTTRYGKFPAWVNYVELEKNAGAVHARMQGWKRSKGEFVWFFDGDDLIAKDSLKEIVNDLSNEDLHVYKMVKQKKNKKIVELPIKISTVHSIGYSSYFGDKIFKSSLIYASMFDLKSEIFQDENFILRFGSEASTVRVHKEIPPVSCYLYNFGSISKNKTTLKQVMKLINNVRSLITFIKFLPNNKFKNKARKQMTRMLVIAKGWSLKLKRKERKKVLRKAKYIRKENEECFKFVANYSIANILINIVAL